MTDAFEKFRLLSYQIPGIKQKTPETCWCAALAWWSKAHKKGRPQLNQDQIYFQYSAYTKMGQNHSNMISPDNYKKLLSEKKWKAKVEFTRIGTRSLDRKLKKGPIIIGYWYPTGGHVVVAIAPSISYANKYMVMDPAFGTVRAYSYGKFSSYEKVLVGLPR